MTDVPPEVAGRIRRPAPAGLAVLDGSLPVISFGDFRRAKVATLALNPSSSEFLDARGQWLLGTERRLASRFSLVKQACEELSDDDVARVFAESNAYFEGPNWLRRWFCWLETLLVDADLGSYLNGSACHLDLVQWATQPAQGKLAAPVWTNLVEADRAFLTWQLANCSAPTLLVNGAACVRWLEQEQIVSSWRSEQLNFRDKKGAHARLMVYRADQHGRRFIGWNRPVAGQIPAEGRAQLTAWLAAAARDAPPANR